MRSLISILLLAAPALHAAEEVSFAPRKKLSAISLLPDGSQLHGVVFPRYDSEHRLINVLKARVMTLISADIFSGESVTLGFFGLDGSSNGRLDLVHVLCDQSKETLTTADPVSMHSDRLSFRGNGLYYAYNQGRGFLTGPATTWIQPHTATPMNSSHSSISAAATVGMSLLTLPLAATPPPAVTPPELAVIQAEAASKAPVASQAVTKVRAELDKDRVAAEAATTAATEFVAQAGLAGADESSGVAATPLGVQPGPNDTVISCDGGMYFDADEGVFVYFKNVRVRDPQFSLTGANELKIFLSPKAAEAATPKSAGLGLGAKFGEVDHIIATGAVKIVQKQPDAGKEAIEASGAFFTYHAQTGQIILSGGYPWVKQGSTFMRAKEPNLSLRVLKNGSFVTEGNWDMSGRLDRK